MKNRFEGSDDVMRFDLCVTTSVSPHSCLSPEFPGGMDESELGGDVTLMIICQAYQHHINTYCPDHTDTCNFRLPQTTLDPNSVCGFFHCFVFV